MTPMAPTSSRSAVFPRVAAPVKVATAAGLVVVDGGGGLAASTGLDETGLATVSDTVMCCAELVVVGLATLSETVMIRAVVLLVAAGFQGTVISHGQSVMVNVVASVTVKVLVPCVNVVGPGQNVVYSVTVVVVHFVPSLVVEVVELVGLDV